MIRLFSTPTCPYCVALKSFLEENKIEFQYVDVAEDQKAQKEMIAKTNQMGVPVLDIDGKWIVGFDKEKISEILDIE